MENEKELDKILIECLTENCILKKKRPYWSIKRRKLESAEDVALSTKIKDLYDQIKNASKIKNCVIKRTILK